MLTSIKAFFSGWIAKVVFGLLIATALLAWYFKTEYEKKASALTTAQGEVTRLDSELTMTKEELKTLKQSNDLTEKVNDANRDDKKEIAKIDSTVARTVATKVREIEQKYEVLPPTPENTTAKQDEKSAARLQGVWAVFCSGMPTHDNCRPAAAASSASK